MLYRSSTVGIATGGVMLLGTGNGTFVLPKVFEGVQSSVVNFTDSLQVADVNHDNNIDLLVLDNYGFFLYLNNGNRDDWEAKYIQFPDNVNGFEVRYQNDDSFQDIIASDSYSGFPDKYYQSIGNGDGTFTTTLMTSQPSVPIGAKTGDFNEDGLVDYVIANPNFIPFHIELGVRNGGFTKSYFPTVKGLDTTITAVAVSDFNGDHHLDLAASHGQGDLNIYLGDGKGSFNLLAEYPFVWYRSYPVTIVSNDYNGDLLPDLAILNQYSDTLTLLIGNGDGTFAHRTDYAVGGYPTGLVSADFNNDGKPDLIVENSISHDAMVLYNSCNQGLTSLSGIPGDVNGDGRVSVRDTVALLQSYLGIKLLNDEEIRAGDVRPKPGAGGRLYGDGQIQADDVNWSLRRTLGLEVAP